MERRNASLFIFQQRRYFYVKTKERISDLLKQGVSLAVEIERLKRRLREYIEKVEELGKVVKEGCEKDDR